MNTPIPYVERQGSMVCGSPQKSQALVAQGSFGRAGASFQLVSCHGGHG